MTDALLPPDPSRDGRYWIQFKHIKFVWIWSPHHRDWWHHRGGEISTQKAYEVGYRLASPHPIPPPEQLNALHALQRDMQRSDTNWAGEVPAMAARLRAALDAKLLPNGPPGNGLDDIRAATMDQCGVPRAGEETAP